MAAIVATRRWLGVLRPVLAPARLLERTRGRKRVALIGLYCVIIAFLALLLWRESRATGLPDIGDPFDPGPVYAIHVPDEQNAFVLYAKANAKAQRDSVTERRLLNAPYAWPAATDAEGLAFIKSNEEALAIWREGCERPDALYTPIKDLSFETPLPLVQEHRHFFRLAQMHASRCEAAGDMAGAWEWYRVMLRGSRLVGRHGTIIARLVGCAEYAGCQARIGAWAADARVDAVLLNRAINDVQAINMMTSKTSESVKLEYLSAMKMIKDTRKFLDYFYKDPWSTNEANLKLWYYHLPGYWPVRWFIENEPKVTRLSLQLVFANWLSQCDLLPEQRAPLVGAKASGAKLFDLQPTRGALGPRALIARTESSFMAGTVFPSFDAVVRAYDRDLRQRAGLVMFLADKLYERKYGKAANSPDDLLGTCLERFPEGYVKPADLDGVESSTPR